MELTDTDLCPAETMADVIAILESNDERGLARIGELAGDYPLDPRLPFLSGSVLAGMRRYDEARLAMSRAVDMAPDYAIARFQLGFLAFTSGDSMGAQAAWEPFARLAPDSPWRLFAEGLSHLSRDAFAPAVARLKDGMARNNEHPIVNRDMQRLIDEIQLRTAAQPDDTPMSSAQMLLQQDAAKGTKH